MAALVAAVFAALLGYYVYNRHASRRACAQADVEKVLMQQASNEPLHPWLQNELDKSTAAYFGYILMCFSCLKF